MADLASLRAELAELEQRLKDLDAAAGDRALTPEEQETWDNGIARVKELRDQIAAIEARRAHAAALMAHPGHVETGQDVDVLVEGRGLGYRGRGSSPWDLDAVTRALHHSAPETGGSELRARALDAIEHMPGVNAASKERMTRLVESLDLGDDSPAGRGARLVASHIVTASSPEYTRAWSAAFRSALRTGQPDVSAMGVLQRAASLTDSAGGYAVPVPIDPTLVVNADGSVNPLRQIATTRVITTNQIEVVNVSAVTASFDPEASEVSDDTPTWGNQVIPAHMARAFIPHSIEIGMDYPGFMDDIRMLFTEARDDLEARAFTIGSGSGEPHGVVTALTSTPYVVSAATDDTFALDDVYRLDSELPDRFASNASWLAHRAIYNAIRQAGGPNLPDFWVGLRDGRPSQLLGHTPYEASYMDGSVEAGEDNYVLLLGDFRWFWIVDRVGFSVELIPHLFGPNQRPTGQRGVFAYWRTGADVVQPRAFRLLKV